MEIRAILVLSCYACVAMFIWLGYAYLVDGQGLHPLLSAIGATIFYFVPMGYLRSEAKELGVDLEDLLEEHGELQGTCAEMDRELKELEKYDECNRRHREDTPDSKFHNSGTIDVDTHQRSIAV